MFQNYKEIKIRGYKIVTVCKLLFVIRGTTHYGLWLCWLWENDQLLNGATDPALQWAASHTPCRRLFSNKSVSFPAYHRPQGLSQRAAGLINTTSAKTASRRAYLSSRGSAHFGGVYETCRYTSGCLSHLEPRYRASGHQ